MPVAIMQTGDVPPHTLVIMSTSCLLGVAAIAFAKSVSCMRLRQLGSTHGSTLDLTVGCSAVDEAAQGVHGTLTVCTASALNLFASAACRALPTSCRVDLRASDAFDKFRHASLRQCTRGPVSRSLSIIWGRGGTRNSGMRKSYVMRFGHVPVAHKAAMIR